MVALSTVQASNSLIASTLLPRLVAVFVGATSGIGETSLKQFAKHARQPRAYFVGRSQAAADRILSECKTLNPAGEYTFIKADISLIRVVDDVCKEIAEKERAINILFLSAGIISFSRTQTSENLDLMVALAYYSRMRFIVNLLPLLQEATSLRRVVTVFAGTKEGPMFVDDFQCAKVSLFKIHAMRGHLCSLIDLSLEAIAKKAPTVSFIHDYPGFVATGILNDQKGFIPFAIGALSKIFGSSSKYVPIEECGERHLFLATSAKYLPPSTNGGDASGVAMAKEVTLARGTDGKTESGVYAIDNYGESADHSVEELLAGMRANGMVEKVWKHTEDEFERITGETRI